MKRIIHGILLAACIGAARETQAQIPVPPPAPAVQLRSAAELDQMLGPIALYPDPLLAQMLPAATTPSEVVLADRYLGSGGDANLIDQQTWSPSVKAMARYPTMLKWMDDNLAWTTAVGQAFLYQQQDVMDSVQRLRAQALALGNLQTTAQDTVVNDNGTIEILPANPQVIYVPVYQPSVVYYQRSYGTPFISFGLHLAIGPWLNHDFDWRAHHVIVWHHDQPRPQNWWSRRPSERPRPEASHATIWRPRSRPDFERRDMDRGWGNAPSRAPAPPPRAQPHPTPARQPHGAPVAEPRPANPTRRATPAGALIGIQSSREAREYSNRGRESRQAMEPRKSEESTRSGEHGGGARKR